MQAEKAEKQRTAGLLPLAPLLGSDKDGRDLAYRLRRHIVILARVEIHEAGDVPVHLRDQGGRGVPGQMVAPLIGRSRAALRMLAKSSAGNGVAVGFALGRDMDLVDRLRTRLTR